MDIAIRLLEEMDTEDLRPPQQDVIKWAKSIYQAHEREVIKQLTEEIKKSGWATWIKGVDIKKLVDTSHKISKLEVDEKRRSDKRFVLEFFYTTDQARAKKKTYDTKNDSGVVYEEPVLNATVMIFSDDSILMHLTTDVTFKNVPGFLFRKTISRSYGLKGATEVGSWDY